MGTVLPMRVAALTALALTASPLPGLYDARLKPDTVGAFDSYVQDAEALQRSTLAHADRFLAVDRLSPEERTSVLARLGRGDVEVEKPAGEGSVDVPGGLVHHWRGTVFVRGATLDAAVALLQDYDRHAVIYSPAVVRSRVIGHPARDEFDVSLRFYQKHVIGVTIDTVNHATFVRPGPGRAASRIASTRVAEVVDAGEPDEHERTPGDDSGFLWRLNTYWRFLERDGGTYIECESITLTRGVPTGLGWVVGPYVERVPRDSLVFTLERTRDALRGTSSGSASASR